MIVLFLFWAAGIFGVFALIAFVAEQLERVERRRRVEQAHARRRLNQMANSTGQPVPFPEEPLTWPR